MIVSPYSDTAQRAKEYKVRFEEGGRFLLEIREDLRGRGGLLLANDDTTLALLDASRLRLSLTNLVGNGVLNDGRLLGLGRRLDVRVGLKDGRADSRDDMVVDWARGRDDALQAMRVRGQVSRESKTS